MKKAERLVYFYDMSMAAFSRTFEAPASISVRRAFELMEMVPKDQRIRESAKGQQTLYVVDWEVQDGLLCILVSQSDKTMSDPVFTVPKENKRRTAEKEDKEGQDFSVHIVVKLPDNDLDSALLIVEQCSGLGVFVVQRLFNQILKDAKVFSPEDYEQFHPDGAIDDKGLPKKLNVVHKCEFQGHLSDELKDDLNHGKVQAIELITDKDRYASFDEAGYIKEKCKTLVLTLKDEEHPIEDKYDRIVKVFKQQHDQYDHAKIKFKTPEGIDRTVDMNTAEGLAQAYVKKAKLEGFQVDLKSSYENFCPAILDKMKDLFNQEA
jgi:hypothetical protein